MLYPVPKKLTFLEMKHSAMWLSDYISASCAQFLCMPNVDWLTAANLTEPLGSTQGWTTLLFSCLCKGRVQLPLYPTGIQSQRHSTCLAKFSIYRLQSWFFSNFLHYTGSSVTVSQSRDVGGVLILSKAGLRSACVTVHKDFTERKRKTTQDLLVLQRGHFKKQKVKQEDFIAKKAEILNSECEQQLKGDSDSENFPALNTFRPRPAVFLNSVIFYKLSWAQCRGCWKLNCL